MPTPSCRRRRRSPFAPLLVAAMALIVILLVPVLESAAQGSQIQRNPTPTPTEEFDPNFVAQATEVPTREPQRTTPTEEPTREPIDDVVANPTDEPEPASPSSLTLNKGACDDSNFDPYTATGLQAFLDACFSPDGEFEFTVFNDVAFNTTQSTELGSLFMQVPTGPITITETIPDGWGDPAVFCWSNLFPAPTDTPFIGNSPMWDVAEGEDVECWWFNVSEPAGHTIRVEKRVCAEGYAVPEDYWTLANDCTETFQDVGFAMTTDSGTVEGVTDASGMIEWTGVNLGASGQVQVNEDVPDGYGEPVVWCVNFPVEAADAQDFDFFQVESVDGLVAAIPEQHAPFIFHCTYFNVIGDGGAPDDLTDPAAQEGGEGVDVTVIKHRCPLGVPEDATYDQYIVICTALFDGIGFTLEHAGGSFPVETANGGEVEWLDVPAGAITIQEALPPGYIDPFAFCGFFDGEQELQFGQEPAPGGQVDLDVPDDATDVTCWFFNIPHPDSNNTITVIKQICPPGIDTGALDKNFYLATCGTAHEGVNFTLSAPHGEFPDHTDGDGVVEWVTVPLGDFSIQEAIPEGYGEPVVFCNFADVIQGIGFQNGPPMKVQAPGGLVSAAIEEPNVAYLCYYFNIPEADHSLTVNKWLCPVGFDQGTGDAESECIEPMDGVTFTLDDLEATTGDVLAGSALFIDVLLGDYDALTEVLPEGIDYAFIGGCSINGEDVPLLVAQTNPPSMKIHFDEGEHWVCEWYNVPAVESRVLIDKRICADDVDLVLTDDNVINDIITACPTNGDGIEFTLDHAGGSSTQAIVDGVTYWDGVPNGPITVTEEIPAGYEEPVWYCKTNPKDDAGDVDASTVWELQAAPGGVINATLDEPYGEVFACWVFNVVDPDATIVTVLKWLCPAGFDVEVDDPVLECTEPMDNVNFTLDDLVATTGDAGPGVAVFEDVPPGDDYELTEFLPGDIAYAFVTHCTQPGEPDLIPLSDDVPPVVSLDVDQGDHWTCYWYNVPGEDNDILIHKWLCPEGFDPNSTDQEYFDTCTESLDGIAFKAMSDLGIAVLDTVGGQVGFGGFPAGMNVGIQEEIPDGYDNPYVICEFDDDAWHDVGASSGFFEIYFAGSGETVECHVFNLHGEQPDLTILKWTCPEGYDLFAAGADPATNCTAATNGIEFELRFEGDATLQQTQTTGDVIDGGVIFDDLEPDIYNVAELVPDGIALAFVLECTGHIMGMLQPYPLQFGPVLDDIDLDAGEHLVCHWYNVPDDDGGDLTVIKYTCATEEFVSEIDCQIEEDGKTFDLSYWTGTWDLVDTATTDGFGRIHWTGLEPGEYWFDEHDGEWCHIASDELYEDGPWVVVPADQETIVHVYNCDGTPGQPGDTPEKYPNTGVPPETATPSAPTGPEQAAVTRVGFLDAFGTGFDLFGPFAGVVGLMVMIWRTIDTRDRIARDRERTEERQWYEAAAAARDRPDWMAGAAPARTARPEWMRQVDDNPLSRPTWMKKEPIFPDDQRRE